MNAEARFPERDPIAAVLAFTLAALDRYDGGQMSDITFQVMARGEISISPEVIEDIRSMVPQMRESLEKSLANVLAKAARES